MVVSSVGIIPARAGFTWTRRRSGSPTTDHPRSRGVYKSRHWHSQGSSGSSPLARGLPAQWAGGARGSRIIPARAGFTEMAAETTDAISDHPRSRGVYRTRGQAERGAAGSSPLARGLPDRAIAPPPSGRIIPARAGFTDCRIRRMDDGQDHPRSRGVYTGRSWRRWTTPGSSPLARGLRARLREELAADRIIPARAGFTAEAG